MGGLKKKILTNPYLTINSLLAGFILLIFLYSAIFSPEKNNYPIHSSYKIITGNDSMSTGLSRGFSSIIRFRFEEALRYNPFSIRIFMFFLIQLLLRIFFISYLRRSIYEDIRFIVIPDIVISIVLFVVFFEPFWREMFSNR